MGQEQGPPEAPTPPRVLLQPPAEAEVSEQTGLIERGQEKGRREVIQRVLSQARGQGPGLNPRLPPLPKHHPTDVLLTQTKHPRLLTARLRGEGGTGLTLGYHTDFFAQS